MNSLSLLSIDTFYQYSSAVYIFLSILYLSTVSITSVSLSLSYHTTLLTSAFISVSISHSLRCDPSWSQLISHPPLISPLPAISLFPSNTPRRDSLSLSASLSLSSSTLSATSLSHSRLIWKLLTFRIASHRIAYAGSQASSFASSQNAPSLGLSKMRCCNLWLLGQSPVASYGQRHVAVARRKKVLSNSLPQMGHKHVASRDEMKIISTSAAKM